MAADKQAHFQVMLISDAQSLNARFIKTRLFFKLAGKEISSESVPQDGDFVILCRPEYRTTYYMHGDRLDVGMLNKSHTLVLFISDNNPSFLTRAYEQHARLQRKFLSENVFHIKGEVDSSSEITFFVNEDRVEQICDWMDEKIKSILLSKERGASVSIKTDMVDVVSKSFLLAGGGLFSASDKPPSPREALIRGELEALFSTIKAKDSFLDHKQRLQQEALQKMKMIFIENLVPYFSDSFKAARRKKDYWQHIVSFSNYYRRNMGECTDNHFLTEAGALVDSFTLDGALSKTEFLGVMQKILAQCRSINALSPKKDPHTPHRPRSGSAGSAPYQRITKLKPPSPPPALGSSLDSIYPTRKL